MMLTLVIMTAVAMADPHSQLEDDDSPCLHKPCVHGVCLDAAASPRGYQCFCEGKTLLGITKLKVDIMFRWLHWIQL